MVWQKIDDQFGISRKVVRIPQARRQQSLGLWLLALNYAGRSLTDGVLEEHELTELRARPGDVAELIRVGLWHGRDDVCDSNKCPGAAPDGGATIHDFWEYNPTKAQVLERRESERVRKMSQRDKNRDTSGTSVGVPGGVRDVSKHPVPVPVPDPVPITTTDHTHDSEVRPEIPARVERIPFEDFILEQAAALGIRNLTRVQDAIEGVIGRYTTSAIVIDTARAVILLAKDPVTRPEAYIERTAKNTPETILAEFARAELAAPVAVA